MEKFYFLFFVISVLIQFVNCNRFIDWLESVSDPTFVCPHSCKEKKELNFQFFSILDCDEEGSRWDYDFQVNNKKQKQIRFKFVECLLHVYLLHITMFMTQSLNFNAEI